MKTVTVDQVMAWRPCGCDGEDDGRNYTRARVERLFNGREALSAKDIAAFDIPAEDIAAFDIPAEDRVWALLHNELLTDEQMHSLACDFAEHVVHLCGDDPRPQAAIAAKRAWLRGEIGDKELAAARDAAGYARDAAGYARDAAGYAGAAAWYARAAAGYARAAAWYTARAAAWYTARAAAGYARAAAWYARAAAGYARAAAGYAAWYARAAEQEWQLRRILEVVGEREDSDAL